MKAPALTLGEFTNSAMDLDVAHVTLKVQAPMPPQLIENLKTLRKVGLLTDEVVLSLLAQAPIDPLGVFGAMKDMGTWAFSAIDFTVVQIIAKKVDMPVALMRIDLMSDDITFVALEKGQLVQVSVLEADFIAEKLRAPGTTEGTILALIQTHMKEAIEKGWRSAG